MNLAYLNYCHHPLFHKDFYCVHCSLVPQCLLIILSGPTHKPLLIYFVILWFIFYLINSSGVRTMSSIFLYSLCRKEHYLKKVDKCFLNDFLIKSVNQNKECEKQKWIWRLTQTHPTFWNSEKLSNLPKVTPVVGSHSGQELRCSNSQSSILHYIMSCLMEPNKLGLRNVICFLLSSFFF